MNEDFDFPLSTNDLLLFTHMEKQAASPEEQEFFSQLSYKERHEPAFSNELLVHETENPDGIFLLRKYSDTYLIGYKSSDAPSAQFECNTLSTVLQQNLAEVVHFPQAITLWQWLRAYNYSVVRYNRNFDLN